MKVEKVNGFWGGRVPIMRLMCNLRKGTAKTAQTGLVPVTVCTKRSLLLCPQACLDALATCQQVHSCLKWLISVSTVLPPVTGHVAVVVQD
jgi:hypothetical protein